MLGARKIPASIEPNLLFRAQENQADMFSSIREKARKFQHHLTRLDDQPLGKAALVIILFLDLFILISIFDGLADHTGQLTAPDQHIPPLCREIVIDRDWNPTNRLGHLAQIISRHRDSYYTPDARAEKKPQHALCAPIVHALRAIREDEGLSRNLIEDIKLQQETRELRAELERMKGAYDTSLLETIARPRQAESNVASMRKEIADKTGTMNELVRRQRLLEASLEQDNRVRALFALAAGVSATDRRALRDDLRRLNFWYPVQRLGMEMLFLLPLFLVFYFWNSRSIAGNRPFQKLVSSHLLVIVLIPVFFKLVELVYDILPRKLLKHVIDLLESLKLVAIWHYLVMGAVILLALALIYLFQNKLFSRAQLLQRRIAKGLCQDCGQRLPPDSPYCPACGAGQYRACIHCHAPTHVHGKYCKACGHTAA
jgi:RNA polymerase subunit RPABC4/transcription elongation factor Spt4